MKKIIYAFAGVLALLSFSSCSMFKYDVLDGPNAQINGRLVDVQTGEKIGIEYYSGSSAPGTLIVVEHGWDSEAEQGWLVRFDGMYTNNLIFSGDYSFFSKRLPCYQPENNTFTAKPGKNRMDISLLPFCRILNPVVRYDAATKKILATFSVEVTDPAKANQVTNVALCGNTQVFVGCNSQNLVKSDGKKTNPKAKLQDVNPGEVITLELDTTLPENAELFRYKQDRYFRIAAMASGNGYNANNYYNFSPIYKFSPDFSSVEEVVWDENEW